MYLLHPTDLLKRSFGSHCNPRLHLIQPQKIYFYILIVLFIPNSMLHSSEKFSLSLRQSFIDEHWMKGKGNCRTVTFVLATIVGSKNKNIHLRDFKDVDFNFTHFANFKFAYFEIEESFGLIWVKLQNGRFHLWISILGT